MPRRANLILWLGALVVLATPVAYLALFIRFPATRDFPWPTLLMFGIGLALIARGLIRAWREPSRYRGKIAGTILAGLSVALLALFCISIFYVARQLPSSEGAPRVGQQAPDFTLTDQDGRPVTLASLMNADADGAARASGVLLVFYRGYW